MNIGLGFNSFAVSGLPGETLAPSSSSQAASLGVQSASASSGGGEFFATLGGQLQAPSGGVQSKPGGKGLLLGADPKSLSSEILQSPASNQAPQLSQIVEAFLEEIQDKYSITGQEALQAFSLAQAPTAPDALAQPAAQKFVQALGLSGSDADSVKAMYQKLMADLQRVQSDSGDGRQKLVELELLSAQDFKQRQLNQSIDRMNQSFFGAAAPTQPPKKGVTHSVESGAGMSMNRMEDSTALESFTQFAPGSFRHGISGSGSGRAEALSAEALPTSLVLRPDQSSNSQASVSQFNKKKGLSVYANQSGLNPFGVTPANMDSALTDFSADLGQGGAETGAHPWSEELDQASLDPQSLDSLSVAADSEFSLESLPEFSSGLTGASPAGVSSASEPTLGSVAEFLPQPPTVSAEDNEANIRELIQKAEVLLKDGGGEMKIDLKPEGLGQVRLRVAVVDGHVQVQMISENQRVRSLLEEGALDLKNQLMAQSLKVDQIAIDKVDRPMDSSFQPPQDFGQNQQQREMARDFMESFREERQAFRQNLAGIPKLGRSAQERQEIQPLTPNSRRGSGERRLDLVA